MFYGYILYYIMIFVIFYRLYTNAMNLYFVFMWYLFIQEQDKTKISCFERKREKRDKKENSKITPPKQ